MSIPETNIAPKNRGPGKGDSYSEGQNASFRECKYPPNTLVSLCETSKINPFF